MEIAKPIPLPITDNDLDRTQRQSLKSKILSTRTLGAQEDANRRILDLLPSLIAERIRGIVPDDFELDELEFKFEIQGKLFGSGVGGEVIAKLKKRSADASSTVH